MFLTGALVNPGDEVLMPGPCYSPYITYTKFFEGKPVTYRTMEENDWAPDLSDLEKKVTDRTRLIIIINPSNPTGSVYSEKALLGILEIAAAHNIPVAADEIYDRIIFDGKFTSITSIAKDVPILCLNGFSKAYLMTGWRLGYIYTQDPTERLKDVWEAIEKLSRVRLCASTPAQYGGIAALTGPQGHITQMVSTLKRRRDFAWKRLTEIEGLTVTKPQGAFYLFPKVTLQGTNGRTTKSS